MIPSTNGSRKKTKVLLDTPTFLWLTLTPEQLSDRARAIISEEAETLYLSAISAWEIAQKYVRGSLILEDPPHIFVPYYREKHLIEPLPFHEDAALMLNKLPVLHRDPFDRMLVCQALIMGLTLLTSDRMLAQYPILTEW